MSAASMGNSSRWEGLLLDGFPLRQSLGGDNARAVFTTEYQGGRAAIKVVSAAASDAERMLSRWRLASQVKHPHLIRLLQMGRSQLDGAPVAYVVMEYAEENLGQVLSERSLTPLEAEEMLGPALEAIARVHRDGFIHGRLTPANIMAVNDCLKLSSHHLRRVEDSDDLPDLPGAWRSPEVAAGGKPSPAADTWALGVTLAETLTQRRLEWTPNTNQLDLPDGIPAPFAEIIGRCLRSSPEERPSAADLIGLLKKKAHVPRIEFAWWYAIPAAVVVMAILAFWLGQRSPDLAPPRAASSRQAPEAAPSAPPARSAVVQAPSRTPAQVRSEPSPSKPDSPAPAAPAPASAPPPVLASEPAQPAAAPEPPAASGESALVPQLPEVVNQIMPDVLEKARRSIHGTVSIGVRVHVDAYGNVRNAALEPPPVSRYFSGVTMKAVRRWKFRPVREGDVYAPQQWIVRFEFTRSDTKVAVEHVAP